MRYESAQKFWQQCIRLVSSGEAGHYVENVAVLFDEDTNEGAYDCWSSEKFDVRLNEVMELTKLWDGAPRKTAGDLLLKAMEESAMPPNRLSALSRILARSLAESMPDKPGGSDDTGSIETDIGEMLIAACEARPPRKIRDSIAKRVIGQSDAVKAAAMITHGHLSGRRTNAVFCGPSGCGKSEIWRCLSAEYPGLIRIVDFSRFTAEGWKGSLHLRDIFDGTDPESLKRRGLIAVLDEADKIVCEHAMSGGTDHNALTQNSLLKMLDGDTIEFGAEDGKPAFSVDCSKLSVVMLGAFERLLVNKSANAKHIGFGAAPKTEAGRHKDISYDDLISAGMRREIAGRINKIVALDPLTAGDYKAILNGPVLSGLQSSLSCRLRMTGAAADAIAEQAVSSGLGVRWMKSAIRNAVDDALFDEPESKEWQIGLRNGRLHCRALKPCDSIAVARRYL